MPTGYQHYAILRMSPQDGADDTLDMMLGFTDCKGPTIIGPPSYEILRDEREDINLSLRSRYDGLRFLCRLRFAISETNDTALLNTIVARSLDPDQWTLYLSIDGGYNEYEVELAEWEGPIPFNGMTRGGAEWVLEFIGSHVITEVPDIIPGLSPPVPGTVVPPPVPFTMTVPLVSALPTASRDYAGRLLRYASNTEEQVWVCLLQDDGSTYVWAEWGTGGLA